MAEEQLSIRSTKARALAHKLARKQRRTVSQIVELALEKMAESTAPPKQPQHREESPEEFWSRIHKSIYPTGNETDIDLDKIIQDNRHPPRSVDL